MSNSDSTVRHSNHQRYHRRPHASLATAPTEGNRRILAALIVGHAAEWCIALARGWRRRTGRTQAPRYPVCSRHVCPSVRTGLGYTARQGSRGNGRSVHSYLLRCSSHLPGEPAHRVREHVALHHQLRLLSMQQQMAASPQIPSKAGHGSAGLPIVLGRSSPTPSTAVAIGMSRSRTAIPESFRATPAKHQAVRRISSRCVRSKLGDLTARARTEIATDHAI